MKTIKALKPKRQVVERKEKLHLGMWAKEINMGSKHSKQAF